MTSCTPVRARGPGWFGHRHYTRGIYSIYGLAALVHVYVHHESLVIGLQHVFVVSPRHEV